MFDLFVRSLPLLESAVTMTVFLGLSSFALGSALGLAVALARVSSIRSLRGLAFAYVSVFRGTPLLVQILLIYFGLPRYGITLEPVPAALLALTLFSAAYLSENFRSGINAVDRGQWEAAHSLGMNYWKMMWRVILPQGLRIAIPPVGSRMIALIKDTSLASTITVVELTRVADQVGASTFRYMEMFLMVGLIYWVINQILTIVQTIFEGRVSRRFQ
ncbi:amino acid ABC transporter permease [Burkholderia stabilis]|uniref:Putative glutamine transport system permease protein GlnP n=1 Tax=Burkholderia stabilis TaxID=95485 RepID=A0AAJ5NGW3_9BURK|nr:amino acid ABC transporter permease [Burkholderia stabilis]VBB15817.1 Inner membrane amino-acid ABC transporter permease protein yecS,amino acid ABC transporter permease,ABC-type amino acid transport system, permease component,ectoine/hydroxyectoine ABC transporter, permease protein EhuD,Binding-protein-dependent transport system inner membrane component [Burkholderia stabilis]HDR9587637.1 amino acid ABC transporter permease [Burkholderia stabilis]HDR9651851.1 amino acid ABC transporter perme